MYVYCVYCLPVCLFTHHHVTFPETATIQQRFSSTEKKKKDTTTLSILFPSDSSVILSPCCSSSDCWICSVNIFRTLSFWRKNCWTKFISIVLSFDFFGWFFVKFFFIYFNGSFFYGKFLNMKTFIL